MSAEFKYFRLHRNFFKLTGRRDCHSTVVSQYGTHLYKSTLCLNTSLRQIKVLMVFSQISVNALSYLYFSFVGCLFETIVFKKHFTWIYETYTKRQKWFRLTK